MKRTTRITVDFAGPAWKELDRLASGQGRTKARVVRDALSLYSFIEGELRKNPQHQIAILDGNGKCLKVVVVPGLP